MEAPPVETPASKPTDKYIGAEGTESVGESPRSGEAKQRDLDEMLDAALACSFPASDPVGCFSLACNSDDSN
jgi:hypothetical protein